MRKFEVFFRCKSDTIFFYPFCVCTGNNDGITKYFGWCEFENEEAVYKNFPPLRAKLGFLEISKVNDITKDKARIEHLTTGKYPKKFFGKAYIESLRELKNG